LRLKEVEENGRLCFILEAIVEEKQQPKETTRLGQGLSRENRNR